MLEIRITAPEISEAINNLARAIGLAVTNPVGMTIGVVPTNTTSAAAEDIARAAVTPNVPENASVPVAASTETVANPTVPVSAPQTAPVAQNAQNVSYPTPDANAAPAAQAVPTAAPQYTLDMIAKAGTALIDAGKMAELSALLAKYGVEALTTLDPAHYGAFAAELRAMGASI